MTKHYNTSISEDALRILNSKQGDYLSDEVAGPVAVIPIRSKVNIIKSSNRTATGGATIYTTPSDKDLYIKGILFSLIKDATCDVADGYANATVVVEGVTTVVNAIPVLTLTAQNQSQYVSFDEPLKVDRNTVINFSASSFTAGKMSRVLIIYGYTVETTR